MKILTSSSNSDHRSFSMYLECPRSIISFPISADDSGDQESSGEYTICWSLGVCASASSSTFTPWLSKSSSHLFSRASKSPLEICALRRLGSVGAFAIHSTRAFMHVEQGRWPSHLTFRWKQRTQEWPRVIFGVFAGSVRGVWRSPGPELENMLVVFAGMLIQSS